MPKNIAAFGEVMMRLQVADYMTLSQTNTLNYSFSGTGVNVTSALAQLGHQTSLVTTLPANSLGDSALSYVRKLGINTDYVQRAGKYIGMYFLESGFGARSSKVTYSNRLESSFNTGNGETYNFEKISKEIDIIHFCGITLAMNDNIRSQMKGLASIVKNNGGLVVFDCNYRSTLWGKNGYEEAKQHYEDLLNLSDIVLMNEKDAKYILKMESKETDPNKQLTELIPIVAKKYNIPVIAGTHRSINIDNTHSLQGYLYKNDSFTFSQLIHFPVLDRIGSGDAYTSGIIHGELSGFPPEKTVSFATTAGMLAHTVVGDTPNASEAEIFHAMTNTTGDVER